MNRLSTSIALICAGVTLTLPALLSESAAHASAMVGNPIPCQGMTRDGKGNCGQPTTLTTCQQELAAGLPCLPSVASYTAQTPVPVSPPMFKPGNWGVTAAQIESNFGPSQYTNFASNPNLNYQITNMDPFSLSRLSTELARTGNGYLPYVLEEAALHLTAANLAYMRSAFGASLDSYVKTYAPSSIAAQYAALPHQAPSPESSYAVTMRVGPTYVPMPDMSVYDLYLDVYTAAATPTSNRAAIHNMAAYQAKAGGVVGGLLSLGGKFAGGVGFIYQLAHVFDPNLDEQLQQLALWELNNGWQNQQAMGPPTATPIPELESLPPPPGDPDEMEGPPSPDTDYDTTACVNDNCAAPT